MASQLSLLCLLGSVFAAASDSVFQDPQGSDTIAEKIGWKEYLESELSEWHDVPLNWEMNATVPSWVKGKRPACLNERLVRRFVHPSDGCCLQGVLAGYT